MLSEYTPNPTIPTADLDRARTFYEKTLGLGGGVEVFEGRGVFYKLGAGGFLLYPSEFAGTNKATAMGFQVDGEAFDAEVAGLRDAGVSLDTFEMEGMTWVDGVATVEGEKAVWFHDPDGNIISLSTSMES